MQCPYEVTEDEVSECKFTLENCEISEITINGPNCTKCSNDFKGFIDDETNIMECYEEINCGNGA